MKYTVGTLFSGIGVPDLACAMLGMDVLFQVEIDDFCQKVLAKHEKEYWPNVRRFTDVRSVGAGNLPVVDILIGGFPCQDLSFAGRRKGMGEGTRSGLWSAFARIIGELQPRIVVIENVPGILAAVRQTRRVHPARKHANVYVSERERQAPPPVLKVLRQLSEMGYRFSAGCISAGELGAQHKRERWWCVAYRQDSGINRGQRIETDDAERRNIGQSSGIRSDGRTEIESCAAGVGNASGTGREKQHATPVSDEPGYLAGECPKMEHAKSISENLIVTGRIEAKLTFRRHAQGGLCGSLESSVGRNANGSTCELDFVRPVAYPNESQFIYEPPRVTPSGILNRTARIKALGNAWDFRNAYALMYWINEYLNEQDQS